MMSAHVAQRLAEEINKHQGTTSTPSKKTIREAQEKYRLDAILRKGRESTNSVTVATHIAKGIHLGLQIKQTTNLNFGSGELETLPEVSSHLVSYDKSPADTTGDAAHNTAAYELYLLLDLKFEGKSLYQWLDEQDSDVVLAFTQDFTEERDKRALASQFTGLMKPKVDRPSSHTLAKQLYWLVDEDPSDNAAYHLLAPLYPTSLVHQVYERIQEDRFGEASKAARKARYENEFHDGIVYDYLNLAAQKLGGTKPRNVSLLNNERRGINYLLSCAPPVWNKPEVSVPSKVESIFSKIYGNIPKVRETIDLLSDHLENTYTTNRKIRNTRDKYLATLIDELVQLATSYRNSLTPGWSREQKVKLNEAERLWLDPYRATLEEEHNFREKWLWMDWPEEIGRRFGRWINQELGDQLFDYKKKERMSAEDTEFRHWKKELLLDESESGWARELHKTCCEIHEKCKNLSGIRNKDDMEEVAQEMEAKV